MLCIVSLSLYRLNSVHPSPFALRSSLQAPGSEHQHSASEHQGSGVPSLSIAFQSFLVQSLFVTWILLSIFADRVIGNLNPYLFLGFV